MESVISLVITKVIENIHNTYAMAKKLTEKGGKKKRNKKEAWYIYFTSRRILPVYSDVILYHVKNASQSDFTVKKNTWLQVR